MAISKCSVVAVLLAAVASLSSVVVAQNTYPIVLVHGFSGWGRDELFGYKYWGGIQGDLQEQLKTKGYTVYTAAVGPFSSNWDRACELYAQIKGGQVDYGLTHSTKYGHARYGRNYTGLYPTWGNTVNGKVNKIHLIGHSMGGQTIRMLAHMLEKGTTGAPVVEVGSTSPLFAGGKSWVHSITTISTPNQGTTLADGISVVGEAAEDLIVGVFAALGIAGSSTTAIYDA
jgi:triacylglycerol lipase